MRPTREMRPRAILTYGLGGSFAVPSNSVVSYASNVHIDDVANYYEALYVEEALAELAAKVVGYQAHGNTGSTETFDAAIGWHSATLNAATVTFTLVANPTGTVSSMVLELAQDATGGRAIDLPASVINADDLEADLDTTAGVTSLLLLMSRDGGSNWFGFLPGSGGAAASITGPALAAKGAVGEILISDTPAGSPLIFGDLLQNEAGTDLIYADLLE